MKGPFISSGKAQRNNFKWMLFSFIVMLIAVSEANATTLFKVYPLADDYFQKVYMVNHQNRQYYLTVSCKDKDMLSVSISEQRDFDQAPRFNIYGTTESKPKMGINSYTFLAQCGAYVDVKTTNFLEVKRTSQSPSIFTINNVTFSNLHNTFRIVDNSVKWGLGERFQERFRVTDGYWTLWNRDKPWKIDRGLKGLSQQTYGFQPVYLAREADSRLFHLVYFKNTFGLLIEASKDANELFYHSVGGNLHFLILLGKTDPQAVLEAYHDYIGPSHIPPFWSMGYHQCRWGYESADALDKVLTTFDQKDLPIDVIWSDLEYMDKKMIFTVSPSTHGGGRINKLLKKHEARFVPLIDAGVCIKDNIAVNMGKDLDVFLKKPHSNDYYVAQVWPGQVYFVDFHHPNAFTFWKKQLKRLYEEVQFSGIWLDMNEPSNFRGNEPTNQPFRIQQNQGINQMTINVDLPHYIESKKEALYHREQHTYFGHMTIVPTHEFLKEMGLRPFIISRSNSVGSGHFGGHWTGDNVANWEFLRLSISGNFLFQIFGMQMVGADICGFYQDTTEQLCSRWMQLGSFYPFSRNHNDNSARSQEPYSFGNTLLQTSRSSLKTKYALLKYMYTIMIMKKGKGSFFRPISFEFPTDQGSYEQEFVETQFLIGKALMVTPIVYQGKKQRQVYFPGEEETWYEFKIDSKTGKANLNQISKHEGKTKSTIQNHLPSAPPTFLRGGFGLLLNEPANRAAKLNNQFHLLAALKQGASSTQILGINDYNHEPHIFSCINEGCYLHISLKQQDGNIFALKWNYQGPAELMSSIKIVSMAVVEGTFKWISEAPLTLTEKHGSLSFPMRSL